MKLPYWHVDAFADRAFAGNQAAVMPLEDWLPDDILQAISRTASFRRHLEVECEEEPEGYGVWGAQARVEWHIEHVLVRPRPRAGG